MKAKIEGSNLVITIPLQKPTASKSGKTLVVASSSGNKVMSECIVDGKPVTIGLNCYISK